nr:unnamed protein product [Digitaria exilis]
MPTLFSILLPAARGTSAARDAARAAAATASRVARRPAAASGSARSAATAASGSARSAAAAASRASAVRPAYMYPEEVEGYSEEEEEDEDEEEEEEERHKSRAYDHVPAKDVTDKDLESDEAIWALYERWCKAYNKERNHGEMARRFNRFKPSARSVYYMNKGGEPVYLGKFADGINAQERVEVESKVAAIFRDLRKVEKFFERMKFMLIESPNQSP